MIQYRYFKLFSFLKGTYQGGRCPYQKKKDQLSLRRKLDRATQFANDFRNGSIDASQYEASPFMRERSSHRARNEDICSSSAEDETPVQHKNAKAALEMAKRAS